MAHISVEDANAWADRFKIDLDDLDEELEDSLAVQVLAKISHAYDSSTWIDETTTPPLVKKILAMEYMGWYFQRVYSEDEDISNYGVMLIGAAEQLINGIVGGSLVIPGADLLLTNLAAADFYPTDASTALVPTTDDMSLGPNVFSMGTIW